LVAGNNINNTNGLPLTTQAHSFGLILIVIRQPPCKEASSFNLTSSGWFNNENINFALKIIICRFIPKNGVKKRGKFQTKKEVSRISSLTNGIS
jgi:hypothetical protein